MREDAKMNNDVVIFKNGALELEVNITPDIDTVWLSANQMAILFERDEKTIRKHINNVFKDQEVDRKNNTQKMRVDGVKQRVPFYSLNVIISVGYRVKSQRGVDFRQWATSILKDYMIKGYAINQKRLEALNRTIEIQSKMIASALELDEREVLNVIEIYADALALLDDYDHGCIQKPKGILSTYKLSYEECRRLIDSMKYSDTSELFGVEKEVGKLNGILAAVYQNVFGQELYPTIEEKAANLLYFLIKDHPFTEGCKRIGTSIFLEFLNKNNHLVIEGKQIISNSALVAIT